MRLFSFTLARTLVLASTTLSGRAFGQTDVSQRSYDRFRTGVNSSETVLKPGNVASTANQFHKRFVMKVDGKIEGSPLYAAGVTVAGGVHNVIYVATMHNAVFAFDADTGAQLSTRQVDAPVTGYDVGTVKPATIHREWGIVSTPAIDRSTGTIYLVRWGYENGTSGPTFRLFGLDMTDLIGERHLCVTCHLIFKHASQQSSLANKRRTMISCSREAVPCIVQGFGGHRARGRIGGADTVRSRRAGD